MAGVPTRALTAPRPIKAASPRCHSAGQANPGRGSTYRRGKSVQTTGTTSHCISGQGKQAIHPCFILLQLRQLCEDQILPRVKLHPGLLFKLHVRPKSFRNNQRLSLCFDLTCLSPKLIPVGFNGCEINLPNLHRPKSTVTCGISQVSILVCCGDEYHPSRPIYPTP